MCSAAIASNFPTTGLFFQPTGLICGYYDYFNAGLLMRPEHSETKVKTETRECKTMTETETKKLL